MIRIQELKKSFRTEDVETMAINNVSLEVKTGEFAAVMGPSGCGKSTLMNVIGMLDNCTSGSYQFNGEEVSGYNDQQLAELRKNNIGFVFQKFNLIEELTVSENIELPLVYLGVGKTERKRRIRSMLERMNIDHRANHFPKQLSGGQKQRVAIARALVTNPSLILADEPTGNLDSENGIEVMRLLSDLNRDGVTIIMVTHSERDAMYADRVINLFDGQISVDYKVEAKELETVELEAELLLAEA